jgi:dihydrofolate synthase/folylpolyglutamate synthase
VVAKTHSERSLKGRSPKGKAGHPARRGQRVSGDIRTYHQALDFLGRLTNYERQPMTHRTVLGLSRIKRLLAELENPQRDFRSVHIAGTKGKGSTATMLARMLQGNGLRVGLYTSPHIIELRERISLNGAMISEANFARRIAEVAGAMRVFKSEEKPTFFEVLTAAAFLHFSREEVDIAVVEAGMGGRFDATNVLRPEVCGITSISMDHMQQLGDTLEKIAEEKAGVFKERVPVVSAAQSKAVKAVLRKAGERLRAPVLFTGEDIEFSYRFESSRLSGPQARICVTTPTSHFDHLAVPLVGEHQAMNCGVAIGLLDQLKSRGFEIDQEAAIRGLAQVTLPGRMEMLCTKPRVIADGAHNASSIEALMRAIGQNISYDSMVLIFGCCNDKDIPGMLRLLQLGADKVIFTPIKSPRSAEVLDLASAFAEGSSGRMAQTAESLSHALEIAEKAVGREDLICITGSFYLVSEAKKLFADHPHRAKSTTQPVF